MYFKDPQESYFYIDLFEMLSGSVICNPLIISFSMDSILAKIGYPTSSDENCIFYLPSKSSQKKIGGRALKLELGLILDMIGKAEIYNFYFQVYPRLEGATQRPYCSCSAANDSIGVKVSRLESGNEVCLLYYDLLFDSNGDCVSEYWRKIIDIRNKNKVKTKNASYKITKKKVKTCIEIDRIESMHKSIQADKIYILERVEKEGPIVWPSYKR